MITQKRILYNYLGKEQVLECHYVIVPLSIYEGNQKITTGRSIAYMIFHLLCAQQTTYH